MQTRLAHLALLAALALAPGCCTIDHAQMAETASARLHALDAVGALPDSELTPAATRALAERERDAWAIVRARSLGEPVPADVEARVGERGGK